MDGGSRSRGVAGLSHWGGERLLERSACWPKCGRMEVWWRGGDNGA